MKITKTSIEITSQELFDLMSMPGELPHVQAIINHILKLCFKQPKDSHE